jgi:hypothetical protein
MQVMFCCNDHRNGNFTGKVFAVDFGGDGETLKLECRLEGGEPAIAFGKGWVRVAGQKFPITAHGTWVGNWCWDAVNISPEDAAAMANHLRTLERRGERKFSPDVAATELWEKWDKGEPFVAADFEE